MVGIYKFTNKIDGKSYIGQSIDIQKRYNQHKNRYDAFNHNIPKENSFFHEMLRHYGFHNFTFEIVEECSKEELDSKEIHYIKKYNTMYPNGYNKDKGGGSAAHLRGLRSYDDVDKITKLLQTSKMTNAEIGKLFGVSDQTISDLNSGRIWFRSDIKYPIRNGRLDNHEQHSYKCSVCEKEIGYRVKGRICRDCLKEDYAKRKPSKEELLQCLSKNNFTYTGKMYCVSATTIRRWCKSYGLPEHSSDYKCDKCSSVENEQVKC